MIYSVLANKFLGHDLFYADKSWHGLKLRTKTFPQKPKAVGCEDETGKACYLKSLLWQASFHQTLN